MSNAAFKVAQAEAELQAAKTDLAQEKREADKEALRSAIKVGREYKDQLMALEQQFAKEVLEVAQLYAELKQVNEELEEHEQEEPQNLDFPTEGELADWGRKRSRLIARRGEIIPQAQAKERIKEQTRLSAMAVARCVDHQKYVVTNLQNKLADPENFARGWVGGVSRV